MRAVPPFLVLALGAVLTVGAGVPHAQAQTFFVLGSGGTDHGWVFPEGDFPGFEVADPAGDPALVIAGQALPAGALPVFAAGDVTALHFDEVDGELLRLAIEVADIDAVRMQAEHFGIFTSVRYYAEFAVGGGTYRVGAVYGLQCSDGTVGVCEPFTDPRPILYATLYRVTATGAEEIGDLPARVLADEDRVEVLLPRWAFDRAGPGLHPLAGDAVTALRLRAVAGACFFGGPTGPVCTEREDYAPDTPSSDQVYALAVDSHGALIGVDVPRPVDPARDDDLPAPDAGPSGPLVPRVATVDVDAGGTLRVPLVLSNVLDRKALVVPEAVVVSDHAVSVTVPKTVTVPAGDARAFTLDVALTEAADEPLVIEVSVRALGTTGSTGDRITLVVRPLPPLAPGSARLYLHTVGEDYSGLAEHSTALTFSEGMLSTLADDPLDNGFGSTLSWSCLCSDSVREWAQGSRTTRDLHLDPEVPAVLHIGAEVPVPGSLTVQAVVLYGDDVTVAGGERTFALDTGTVALDVPLSVTEDGATLEAGGALVLHIEAFFRPGAAVPLGELLGIVQPLDPRLETEGASWLDLPVVAAADRFGGAAHLLVDLARGSDAVRYVNPGRTVLWNVTVMNQGDADDIVAVAASSDAGWSVRVEPARTYTVPAGGSVTVGLFATAPADAAEGATSKVNLTVASERAEGATAGLGVVAVATAGVAIDEPSFEADNDTAAAVHIEKKEKGTPAPSVVAVVAVVAVMLWASRGRYGRPNPRQKNQTR